MTEDKKSIRLAIIGARGIPARYGGFETFAEELSVRLAERGVDVTVFCEGQSAASPPTYKGVKLRYLPGFRLGSLSPIVSDLWGLCIARRAFDVIYVLGYPAAPFFFVPRMFGTRVWVNVDGLEWQRSKWGLAGRFYLRLMESAAVRSPDRVIADAQAVRTHLMLRHSKIVDCQVIEYGAEIVDEPPHGEALMEFSVAPREYFLVICRLEPENRVMEIVDGYMRSRSKLPLLIVGDGRSGSKYVRRLLEANDERIRLVGSIYDRTKLRTLRYHCKAYLHGHSVGGTNPSLLEALGCGNIVIAHDNVFNREVCEDSAIYFRRGDEIPNAIRVVDSYDAVSRAEIARRARSRIHERYSWQRITDRYVELLEDGLPFTVQ